MSEEIIMMESDEAAQFKTNISGWVDRTGHFWGDDERTARYSGCTHRLCESCQKPIEKNRIICRECVVKRETEKFNAMPRAEWDEVGMLYSQSQDWYFSDWDEVESYADNHELTLDELMLIICEPNYLPLINDDFGCDELAEDGELPDAVIAAIENLNKAIKESGPVSWYPGKYAAFVPGESEPNKSLQPTAKAAAEFSIMAQRRLT